MAARAHSVAAPLPCILNPSSVMVARERAKSLVLRTWIASGLFFMTLPGTLLGFSNLMAISAHHGLGRMPAAWIEGHGHAQVFGWIGSFILGIGFYSQPARNRSVVRLPVACFALWTTGVALRWTANIYLWHWRVLVPLSAAMELLAVALFLLAASHHKLPEGQERKHKGMEPWMVSVLLGTLGLTAAVVFNFVECASLAVGGTTPAFPHALDQKYLVLLGWGFIVPIVWGFSARWLPVFLALPQPRTRPLYAAMLILASGVLAGAAGFVTPAVVMLAMSTLIILFALRLAEPPHGPAKTKGIHSSFPIWIRLSYLWLVVAGSMSVLAAFADLHGGIWGASRHALTVGFAATMVFAIGPRILPHFAGVDALFSKNLMFASVLLLQVGCALRVTSEPLAYEGVLSSAWKILPLSGMLELSGVLLFALNLALTMIIKDSSSRPESATPHLVI